MHPTHAPPARKELKGDHMTAPRTTVRSVERAISGALAAGVEVARVIVHNDGVVEIVAAGCSDSLTSTETEAITCDDVFSKMAQQS